MQIDSLRSGHVIEVRAVCPCCRAGRGNIRVGYCRACTQVVGGEHFHRRCTRCNEAWVEQATERSLSTLPSAA